MPELRPVLDHMNQPPNIGRTSCQVYIILLFLLQYSYNTTITTILQAWRMKMYCRLFIHVHTNEWEETQMLC